MRPTVRTPITTLILMLCALVTAALGTSAGPAAAVNKPAAQPTAACPDQLTPPPPVDTSEQPAPGQPRPAPLAVPAKPVGGGRMGECGYVLPAGAPPLPTDLGFDSWVIQDLDTGAVLAAKDPHARQRPASLIKLLLALVVTRQLEPNTVVIGTQDDANQEGTKVGLGPGGRYTVNQLLHGLLMHSGNDVAYALAVQLGGPQAAVNQMNSLASQLGATDTRAATPSGLDAPGMSTSAYDLSIIFRAALANPQIADALHTAQMTFPGYPAKPDQITIYNDNELLTEYPGDLGGKTGYTDDAQQTYANAASRDGHRVAIVLTHGTNHLDGRWRNGRELMDYGFALIAAHRPTVGQIVELTPAFAGPTKATANDQRGTKTSATGGPLSAFGTVGGPLTGLAAIVVILMGLLYLRRQRAKRARARKTEQAEATVASRVTPRRSGMDDVTVDNLAAVTQPLRRVTDQRVGGRKPTRS